MATTPNGWPVLDEDSAYLNTWKIPGTTKTLRARRGDAGLILLHFALWYHQKIESLYGTVLDDWGYSYRYVGGTRTWSEHAGGVAIDLNALKHPQGVRNTFRYAWQVTKLRLRLRVFYRGVIRWGNSFTNPDNMHYEVYKTGVAVSLLAKRLSRTDRGKAVLRANEDQKRYVTH